MPDNNGRVQSWSPATYTIEVEGLLEEEWSDRFAGMLITPLKREDTSFYTCLSGPIMDQSELAGVLNGLYELNFPILRVEMIGGSDKMSKPIREL